MNKNWRLFGIVSLAASLGACGEDGGDDGATSLTPTGNVTNVTGNPGEDASTSGGGGGATLDPGGDASTSGVTAVTTMTTATTVDETTGAAPTTVTPTTVDPTTSTPAGCELPEATMGTTGATTPTALVDDFDDGDGQTADGNYWYTYADPTTAASMCPAPGDETQGPITAGGTTDGAMPGAGAATISGAVAEYAGFGVDLGTAAAPFDASSYTGVVFDVAGTGTTQLAVAMASLIPAADGGSCATGGSCNDVHLSEAITLSSTWQQVQVPFAELTQVGWTAPEGEEFVPTPFAPSEVIKLQWQFPTTNPSTTLFVDNVGFY